MSGAGPSRSFPPKAGWPGAALTLLAALAAAAVLYGLTICPTVFWGDGMELTAAAWRLGVAHPTGYPLYTLLGRIFLSAPVGTPGLRMNLLSACSALLASALLFGLAGDVIRLARPGADSRSPAALAFRAGVALSWAFSRFVWQNAVLADVHASAAAALIACLWLVVRTWETGSTRLALALSFAYGVAWQCHLLAIVLAPAVGAALLRSLLGCKRGRREPSGAGLFHAPLAGWPRPALLGAALLVFLIGASGYLGLPLRARAKPALNWGDPSTPARLAAHLSGGQFKQTKILSNLGNGEPLRGPPLRNYLKWQTRWIAAWPAVQFLPFKGPDRLTGQPPGRFILCAGVAFWLAALAGLGLLVWRRAALGCALGASLGLGVAVLIVYTIPDIEAYFLAIWPLLLLLFWGAMAFAANRPKTARNVSPLAAALALAAAALAARSNFPACDLSDYREAEAYGRRLMDALPRDALLLTGDDNTIFAAWYQQQVESRRPDVTVFGLNFIFQGWYRAYFETAAAQGLSLFAADRSPSSEADWIVAVGGGVIVPNINRRPVMAALTDSWQQAALLPNWNAQFAADVYDPEAPRPPLFFLPPAPRLYRLFDNPEYRVYQEKQFEEMYGAGQASVLSPK